MGGTTRRGSGSNQCPTPFDKEMLDLKAGEKDAVKLETEKRTVMERYGYPVPPVPVEP